MDFETKRHLKRLIEYDDARQSGRFEHAITALAGGVLALHALRNNNRACGVLEAVAAGALLFRAAAGRDGLRQWLGANGQNGQQRPGPGDWPA